MASVHPGPALEEAVKGAKDHTDLRVYEEKLMEKTPACFLKARKVGKKSHRTMIKLEKKRRRTKGKDGVKPPQFVFDDGGMSFAASSIGNESVASSGSVIKVPAFNENRSFGSKASARFSKGSRKYYGLSPDLMDAASVGSKGSRASYRKSQDDPPEAVLPRGLQFGTPMIMNRSQAVEETEKNLLMRVEEHDLILKHDENEQLISGSNAPRELDEYINKLGGTRFLSDEEHGSGSVLYRKPAALQKETPDHQSKGSLGSDSSLNNSANDFLNWYIKVEKEIKRKKFVAATVCLFLLAFVVTMIVVFTNNGSGGSGSTVNNGDASVVSSGDRTIPSRPPPPIPPVFDPKNVPLLPPSGEDWNEDSLKAMLEAFSHSSLLEDDSTAQGQAYKWLKESNLTNMNGMRVGQRYALAVLYFATHERSWTVETGWLSSDHECTWHGLGCGAEGTSNSEAGTGRRDLQEGLAEAVTYLNLSNNNLYGSLPAELKYLDSLRHLALSENLMMGPIPADCLTKLSSMKTLYLDGNFLDGVIPDELIKMQSLKYLDFSGNTFEGSIPSSIKFATELVDARFSGNSLGGQIPDVFRELSSLSVFLAGSNDIEGSIPPSFGESTSLVTLHLQENELKGSIPDFASTKLQHLHLDSNALQGQLPSLEAFTSGSLEELRLEGNQLTGRMPVELGDHTNLKLLWLNSNGLTSTVPHELGRLEHLTSLQIDRNKLEGSIPGSVCALKSDHNLSILRATCDGSNPDLTCACCDSC